MLTERLLLLRQVLQEVRSRWDWELQQAENARLAGDEQAFLRAVAGFRATQDALDQVEFLLRHETNWVGLFDAQPAFSEVGG
jgi:hypothetical protein